MRKLLQNKAVVSVLAVIAVLAIASNFVKLPSRSPITAAARTTEPAPVTVTPTVLPSVPVQPRRSATLASWRSLFPNEALRDPFTLPAKPSLKVVAGKPPLPSFTLQAISIEPGRAMAVIDRQIVTVGDRLGEYLVEQILPGEVSLQGPVERLVLTLHSASSHHKSP
jgi:hypothetical protein